MKMNSRARSTFVFGGSIHAVVRLLLILPVLLVVSPVGVRADVPSAIPFQGLLLDTAGQPLTDNVDLDFALFDGLGGGTALWSESHLGVAVTDGVYSVDLGSTTPIDAAILSAGPVFLEIRVEGETLAPRQQLLAVPYARVAETVQSVGSHPTLYLEQMIEGFDFDGGLPANTDPAEGTGDIDGDGTPNFLDPDNDNDSISDAAEVAAGSGVNLLTPRIHNVTPSSVTSYTSTSLLVQGTGLSTLQSVSFGAQSVVPTGGTDTSFNIQVNPTHTPASRTVVATLANGQSATSPAVAITNVTPTITSVTPNFLVQLQAAQMVITGTNFLAGTTVAADSLILEPSAITPTSLTVTIPPRPRGTIDLRVVHPNQLYASVLLPVLTTNETTTVFLTQATFSGNLGGLAGADAACQAEANAASLSGTYRAWLSDATISASARVAQSSGGYVMTNGSLIATSWADLTDGTLSTGIRFFANGNAAPSSERVWTATRSDGTAYTATADHCNNWTSSGAGSGRSGLSHTTNVWTDFSPSAPCATSGIRLYCFEE